MKVEIFEQHADKFIKNEVTLRITFNSGDECFLNLYKDELIELASKLDENGLFRTSEKDSGHDAPDTKEKTMPIIPSKDIRKEREREGKNKRDASEFEQ